MTFAIAIAVVLVIAIGLVVLNAWVELSFAKIQRDADLAWVKVRREHGAPRR